MEGRACGTPHNIGDAGGAREVVDGPDAGIIVAREAEAIADGIKLVLAHPRSPHTVAAKAERFDWRVNGRTLGEYYERLVRA